MSQSSATVTVEDVQRTGRTTTVAQWGVAAVVMVGSAVSAGIGFGVLGGNRAVGVITGLGVDLALASGLVIGHRLRAVGITTRWGTVLLWATAVMTLCLNSGAAALTGHWVLAVAHAFLPVLLVVLCEAGSEAQLKLRLVAREAAAAEQAGRDAQAAAQRAAHDAHQQRQDELARARHEAELAAIRAASTTASQQRIEPSVTRPAKRRNTRRGSTARARQEWIEQQVEAGCDVTGADVRARFPDAANAARDVAVVKARVDTHQLRIVAAGSRKR